MVNTNKKSLIIDSSGVRPLIFAQKSLGLNIKIFETFADYVGFDACVSAPALYGGEFSFSYNPQQSIFTSPVTLSSLLNAPRKNFSISMSDAGYFSVTNSNNNHLPFHVSKISADTKSQGILWKSSPNWDFLSPEDKGLITLAFEKSRTYDEVAILTNDWHLRQQCLNFEGISTYGSCSMLAGVVLTGFMSYQKGTYIYLGWLKESPRWIPYNRDEYGNKRKLKFGEVLAIEKSRMEKGNSFWMQQ